MLQLSNSPSPCEASPPWPYINNKVAIMRTVQRAQRFPAYAVKQRECAWHQSNPPIINQSINQSIKRAKPSQAAPATASRLPILTFVLFLDTRECLAALRYVSISDSRYPLKRSDYLKTECGTLQRGTRNMFATKSDAYFSARTTKLHEI